MWGVCVRVCVGGGGGGGGGEGVNKVHHGLCENGELKFQHVKFLSRMSAWAYVTFVKNIWFWDEVRVEAKSGVTSFGEEK